MVLIRGVALVGLLGYLSPLTCLLCCWYFLSSLDTPFFFPSFLPLIQSFIHSNKMKLTTFLPLILAVSTQAASIMPQQSNGEVLHPQQQQQQQEQNWQHNAQLDSAQGASGSGSREEADISTNWGQGQQQGPQQQPPQQQPPQQQQQQQQRQSLDFSSEQKGGSQQDTQSSSSSNGKNDDDLQKLSHAAQALVQKVNDSATCLAKHLGDTPVTSLKLEQIIHLLQSNSRECLGDISSIKGFPLVGDLLHGMFCVVLCFNYDLRLSGKNHR